VTASTGILHPKTLNGPNITTRQGRPVRRRRLGSVANGDVLTVDAIDAPNSEVYNPTTKSGPAPEARLFAWKTPAAKKVGPLRVRPDGTVFAAGANGSGAGTAQSNNTNTKKVVGKSELPGL